jgi:hypothetical protein
MRFIRIPVSVLFAVVLAAPLGAATRRMFVTSVSGTGNLSSWADAGGQAGVDAGDAICQARAAAAGLPNATAYRAWLSDSLDDAYCRIHDLAGKKATNCGEPTLPAAAGPWWRTDGEPFGAGLPELVAPVQKILNVAAFDEFGIGFGLGAIWTGTSGDGVVAANSCSGWTSAAPGSSGETGSSYLTSWGWTQNGWIACSSDFLRLLCFESGVGDPLPAFPAWGRLAFLTSAHGTGDLGGWPEAGGTTGLAAGDAICRSLAAAAGIRQPDSFKAWLSDASTNAIDRFDHDGPWLRLDGVAVATTKADLTDGTLASSIHFTDSGTYLDNWGVWTGTLGVGTAASTHCASWTSGTAGTGEAGSAWNTTFQWTQTSEPACDFEWAYLYCLQDLPLVFFDGFDTGGTTAWSVVAP